MECEESKKIRAGEGYLLKLIDCEGLRRVDNSVFWRNRFVPILSWILPAWREKEGTYGRGRLGIPYFFMRR